jgi:hypothetical protein
VIGLRDKQTGAVHWQRFGVPPHMARLYHARGCVVVGRDWIASLGEWRYHMSFVGESWPEVIE